MTKLKSSLPSSYTTSRGDYSAIGVGLFVVTVAVLIYQLKFYRTLIKNSDNNSDLESRVSRLERNALKEGIPS